MNIKFTIVLSTILIFLSFDFAISQNDFCATNLSQRDQVYERPTSNIRSGEANRLDRTLSISLHMIKVNNDSIHLKPDDVIEMIDSSNILFERIGLSFRVCSIDTIDNFNFLKFDVGFDEEMFIMNYNENTINLYIVQGVYLADQYYSGYTLPPGLEDIIVLAELSDLVFAHQIGHFFGLYHTFETFFGQELVDGSNCEETGDQICDTPADPYQPTMDFLLSFSLDGDCNYRNDLQDSNGDFYIPPTDNIMTFYSQACKCRFSIEQLNTMAEIYLNQRNNLW